MCTYVSEVRTAFRLGLEVQGFESFYALRRAMQEQRVALAARTDAWPTLRGEGGVRLSSPGRRSMI